jgi:hypothetical protein
MLLEKDSTDFIPDQFVDMSFKETFEYYAN